MSTKPWHAGHCWYEVLTWRSFCVWNFSDIEMEFIYFCMPHMWIYYDEQNYCISLFTRIYSYINSALVSTLCWPTHLQAVYSLHFSSLYSILIKIEILIFYPGHFRYPDILYSSFLISWDSILCLCNAQIYPKYILELHYHTCIVMDIIIGDVTTTCLFCSLQMCAIDIQNTHVGLHGTISTYHVHANPQA
jgi:hypothetical protein